jgi:hypothetical protein
VDPIRPCPFYEARPAGTAVYQNGPHRFKVYFADVVGRPEPARYEWDRSTLERDGVLAGLKRVGIEGVGFVCAFPHITKVFRFAPSGETNLHVRAFDTPSFSELNLAREEGYLELTCLVEAILVGEEHRRWADATSVAAYLDRWTTWEPAAVAAPDKLRRYYDSTG